MTVHAHTGTEADAPSEVVIHFENGLSQTVPVFETDPSPYATYMFADVDGTFSGLRVLQVTAEMDLSLFESYTFNLISYPCLPEIAESTVSGTIVQHGNGKPVADLEVCLVELDLCATTDANGSFSFTDVPDGTYTLTSDGPVYKPLTATVEVSGTDVSLDLVQFRGGGQ